MGKKLVSRTAKVLSETKKTKEKEAVAVAYEHIPRNPDEQQHGSLYAVIELEDKSGHAEEIIEKIIDVLHDAYYEDTDKEPLTAFEEALAKINDELTDRSSEGQINWLGNLNAVLAVLSGSTLHVTQAGKAEVYLYRGEHAMHVTEDLSGDSINPQRTFINIASGDLTEKDKVVLLTPGVFYKLSKHELKTFVSDNSPKIASENISKLLAGDNGAAKPNAVLVMEMVSPESFAADEEVEEKTEVWIKEDKNKLEEVGSGVAGGTIKIFDFLGKAFGGASTFITTKVVPSVKSGTRKAKDKIQGFKKEPEAESVILTSEEKISTKKPLNDNEIDLDDGILETPVDKEKEIRIKETRRKPKLLSLERFDFSFLERAKENVSGRTKRLRLPGGKFSFAYILVAVALIIGLVGYLGYSNNIKTQKAEAQSRLTEAESYYNDALAEITGGNYAEATNDLATAESLAEGVLATNYYHDEANTLITKINDTEDEARRITRNTAGLFYEFTENVTNIYTNGEMIYGVDFASGSVYSVDPKAGTGATIVKNPEIGGSVSLATLVESRDTLVVYTENKEVYEIDLTDGEVTKQNVPGEWEEATALNFFGTNIYLLAKNEGQIKKHFKIASGYGAGVDYFPEEVALENVTDMAIDGSIYTVDKNANIKKYISGSEESFTTTDLPGSYDNINNIYARPDIADIFLATNELIIRLDESGKFLAQYANDDVSSIGNLFVLSDKLYFVSENKVYSLGL
ncbi:MAG: hypothetical protein PHW75_02205 [Patescibacteria group bacterium]|nr:hypothetical protein [Patescibacteria group bacterium]